MRLSDDRVNYLAHRITAAIAKTEGVKLLTDSNRIRVAVKALMLKELTLEDEVDSAVRDRLKKRRGMIEGSTEWEVTYQKEYDQEMKRRRGVSA